MSASKRLRIFAGPNGSGKSTLAAELPTKEKFKIGVFVNADEIERDFLTIGYLSLFKYYRFESTTAILRSFIREKGVSRMLLKQDTIASKFKIVDNRIYFSGEYNSYVAADVASFIRKELMSKGKSYSFETVFSHESKLELMKVAKENGYRVYLYFLTTVDPLININRVNLRVEQKGHAVPERKIIDRYHRSLNLLLDAIKLSDRAYLFDNSGKYYELIAEITGGKKVELHDIDGKIPLWFQTHVYNKSRSAPNKD